MSVELVTVTSNAEALVAKLARVSSSNPDNPEYAKLLKYLIQHQHWSPYEMAHMVVSITTSRAIAAQILRHRSFSFQELSQRYTDDIDSPPLALGRKQAIKNRQSSVDELDEPEAIRWANMQTRHYNASMKLYKEALAMGVAREQARMLLPLATPSNLYMAGSARSWIHYIQLRTQPDTQQEHREIAEAIKVIFMTQFPETARALGWT